MDRTYLKASIPTSDPVLRDLVTGLLTSMGFDAFEEDEQALHAYRDAEGFDTALLEKTLADIGLPSEVAFIREENWNARWEASFEPVVIAGKVAVRADFHPPVGQVRHEIVITPKMSFGTGHHATTWLMMDAMSEIPMEGRQVFDFGTGTGVLAILAEKSGAADILAVDNDPWSIDNARENIQRNGCARIRLEMGDRIPEGRAFDLITANINKSVILSNRIALADSLAKGGLLLLSGLLAEDREEVEEAFHGSLGAPNQVLNRAGWLFFSYLNI